MWLLTPLGFFSIVRKPDDAAKVTLTVRARVRSDLDALRASVLPELGVTSTSEDSDYRFRAVAPRSAVAAAMARLVDEIDYPNFKGAVLQRQGSKRAEMYHRVWSVLHDMQGEVTLEATASDSTAKCNPSVPNAESYGGVLMTANGRVLLREPRGHYGGYAWTFAKGRPDPGETPEQTALREVKEETGYDARILAPIVHVFAGTTSTTSFFLMESVGEPAAHTSETAAVRWVSASEAVDLIGQTTARAGRERDLAVLRSAQDVFNRLALPDRPLVRKDDWKTLAMPRQHRKLALDLRYAASAFRRIRKGFLPDVMEEKWFAWFDCNVLHFHRSWTGFCIYKIRFVKEGEGMRAVEAIANRNPEQYASDGDEEDIRLIAELIDCWLVNGPTSPREDGFVTSMCAETR